MRILKQNVGTLNFLRPRFEFAAKEADFVAQDVDEFTRDRLRDVVHLQAAQWAQALRATNQAHEGAPPVTPGTTRLWLDPPYTGVWLDLRPPTG